MDRRSLLLGSALLGAAAPLAAIAAPARTRRPAGFDAAWAREAADFHTDLQADGVVGGSVWFLRDGEVLGREHHGFADLETRRPVDDDTIWHWASITKTFTAISVMQLRDRGRLGLDDPATKYLPELEAIHNPFGSMDRITLRHLITHSSGLRGPTFPWGGDQPWHPGEPAEWSQVAAMWPYTEILFPPGSKYSYSNPGSSILGRIVEEVSGDHIDTYIDKNILKPLGMTRSYFDLTPRFLLKHRSNNYFIDPTGPVANGLELDTGATLGNGGLNTPVPDFIRYTDFLLGLNDNGTYADILSRKSLHEMWVPLFPTDDIEPPQFTEQMGQVFFLVDVARPKGPTRYVGHTGSQRGFRSFFYIEPKSRTSVVWVVNSSARSNYRGMVRAQRLKIFNGLFPLFTERDRG